MTMMMTNLKTPFLPFIAVLANREENLKLHKHTLAPDSFYFTDYSRLGRPLSYSEPQLSWIPHDLQLA